MIEKFFVEIGSADFDTLLSLSENGWKGIIVEPLSHLTDNLKINSNVIIENVGISDRNEIKTFRYYDKELSDILGENWVNGIGTFNEELNHFWHSEYKKYQRTKEIFCITLDELLIKHDVRKIDFLKVDVETMELLVFLNYSWKIKPTMIKIEIRHWIEMTEWNGIDYRSLFFEMLNFHNYIVWEEKSDLYAIR